MATTPSTAPTAAELALSLDRLTRLVEKMVLSEGATGGAGPIQAGVIDDYEILGELMGRRGFSSAKRTSGKLSLKVVPAGAVKARVFRDPSTMGFEEVTIRNGDISLKMDDADPISYVELLDAKGQRVTIVTRITA